MAINRLIALNPLNSNPVDSFSRGVQQRQQQTAGDLANISAQNELDKQANINRLLQQQGQTLLAPSVQQESLATAPTSAPTNPFEGLLTDQDKQQVQLLIANQDIAGLQKLQNEVMNRGREQEKQQREISNKTFDQEAKLRGEFEKSSKDFIKVRDAHTRVIRSAEPKNDGTFSPAGDLALVFNFMKVLDPGSTVREGEFATAAGAKAELARAEGEGTFVPNFVKGAVQKLTEGTILLPDQRRDFVDRSGRLFQGQLDNQKASEARFRGIAERAELNPENIVFEFRLPDGQAKQKKQKDLTEQDFREMSLEDLENFVNSSEQL